MCGNTQLADECQLSIFKLPVAIILTSSHSLDSLRLFLAQTALRIKQAARRTDDTGVSLGEYPTQPSMVSWQHRADRIQAGEKH